MRLIKKAGILILVLTFLVSCNLFENKSNSSMRLLILSITGMDLEGTTGSTTVFADVVTNGSIFNETGTAELSAIPLDPAATTVDISYYQNVIVDQIDIKYSRSDGLSREGVDVPYAFSQKVNHSIEAFGIQQLGFVLIQHTAKLESPLVELVNLGHEKILKLEAEITFHSKDMAGNRLEPVTGSISVWCADFADEEE